MIHLRKAVSYQKIHSRQLSFLCLNFHLFSSLNVRCSEEISAAEVKNTENIVLSQLKFQKLSKDSLCEENWSTANVNPQSSLLREFIRGNNFLKDSVCRQPPINENLIFT